MSVRYRNLHLLRVYNHILGRAVRSMHIWIDGVFLLRDLVDLVKNLTSHALCIAKILTKDINLCWLCLGQVRRNLRVQLVVLRANSSRDLTNVSKSVGLWYHICSNVAWGIPWWSPLVELTLLSWNYWLLRAAWQIPWCVRYRVEILLLVHLNLPLNIICFHL